ncbi:acyltransferase family protein [Leifsonia sp. NPDC058230]|uniref:acyltransferase family protein n=1 Tax=Leifsonia sp. NPDC058230 TaxID=3346391 RepID=UPI0036DC2FBC
MADMIMRVPEPVTNILVSRLQPLDGLRVFAVIAVFAFHAFGDRMLGGEVGVDVFFVLSGFVITLLLLREWTVTKKIRLGRFYFLRLARLWPALLAVCAAVAVIAIFRHDLLYRNGAIDSIWSAIYAENIVRAATPIDVLTASPLGHTWTLGVEEQFYLVWPVLVLVLLRFMPIGKAAVCTLILAFVPLAMRILLWDGGLGANRVTNSLDTRADQLLFGCALALALVGSPAAARFIQRFTKWAMWPAGAVLAWIALFFPYRTLTPGWLAYHHVYGFVVTGLLAAILIGGLATNGRSLLARVLAVRWLAWPGRNLSYGFYLWHYVVLASMPVFPAPQTVRVGVSFLVTAVLALASWRFIETPIREWARARVNSRGVRPATTGAVATPVES